MVKPTTTDPVKTLSIKPVHQDPPTNNAAEEHDKDVSFCDSLPSSQDTVVSHDANKTELDESAAYITASEGRYSVSKASLQSSGLESSSV